MAAAAEDPRANASSMNPPAIVAFLSSMFAVMINSSSGIVRGFRPRDTSARHAPTVSGAGIAPASASASKAAAS